MLRIAAPYVDSWNTWYADTRNSPAGVAPLRDVVDAACRDVGRDPAEVERTVAVHVRLSGGSGRTMGGTSTTDQIRPLEGDPDTMAEELRAYAAAGVSEVQLVLDPIDRSAIERFAPVLAILDRS
jgi:alkanesulfonate monooxygenase SsuD/methylene tetrahydromethanopterin reductase-like flavin-dependent oxidoreductase (luciferase family)